MMKTQILRTTIAAMMLLLAACSSGPQQQPQSTSSYPEPVFTAERLLSDEYNDPTLVYDPWEGMNRRIYNFNYHFDRWVFLPAVRGYRAITPQVVRTGVNNFFNNFRDVRTMVNSILQGSPTKFFQSTGRVVLNTTVGLLGLVDVATMADIPRPQEDFGQTLGVWGLGQGPYLVVPFLGPSNLRDGAGLLPDFYVQTIVYDETMADPLRQVAPLVDAVDTRHRTSYRYNETGSAFEYSTMRWLYSTKRQLDVAK